MYLLTSHNILLYHSTMKSKKTDLDGIILNHIVMELESEKANNSGKLATVWCNHQSC